MTNERGKKKDGGKIFFRTKGDRPKNREKRRKIKRKKRWRKDKRWRKMEKK